MIYKALLLLSLPTRGELAPPDDDAALFCRIDQLRQYLETMQWD